MELKAVIVDDEQHARENLRMLIEEYCPTLKVVGMGQDVASGLSAIKNSDPDIVFLDIRMPSGSEGFEIVRQIEKPRFMVVFVTAFKDYAIDAFKVNAVDYILKPIDIDELIDTVQRIKEKMDDFSSSKGMTESYQSNLERLSDDMVKRSERIAISHSSGVKLIKINDILYLKAESNCTRLIFKDGSQYLDTRTLKVYEDQLKGRNFFRNHRSYVINLEEIQEFSRQEGNQVILNNGQSLPVARSAVQVLLEHMRRL